MPDYKFYYFVNRGRGEAIRQMFHLTGTKFTDEVLTQETWAPIKDDMPLYQVPVLEVDGVKIGESVAILRFLGREFGVAQWPYLLMGRVEGDKGDYFKDKVRPSIDKYAPLVEKLLLDNGNNGLFVGDKETWVEVFAAESFVKLVDYGEKDSLEAYPHIQAMIARIHALPGIRDYLATRKQTVC
ncbi:unnamed protein product, partial [Mesorhabditis spiculigera]